MSKDKQIKSFDGWLEEIFKQPWKEWDKTPKSLAKFPLASPYFVGHFLPEYSSNQSDDQLGRALLDAMREVYLSFFWKGNYPQDEEAMFAILDSMPDKKYEYYDAILLELRFFQDYMASDIADIVASLRIDRTTLWRHFKAIRHTFAKALLDLLGPASRASAPRPDNIVGFHPHRIELLTWLSSGQTVTLSGSGGVGKSTLGILTAYAWPQAKAWSTIWPQLDQPLDRLLFDLGYLLGTPKFWEQVLSEGCIVCDRKTIEPLYDDLWQCQQKNKLKIQGLEYSDNEKKIDLDTFLQIDVLEDACAQVRRCTSHAWPKTTFLFTVRPNLNDRLSTFLFELGHFLHLLGNSNLWKLVLLNKGNIQDSNLARAMLVDDLRACQSRPPLLIIDEVDRLHSIDPNLTKPQHDEFLTFLESLRGEVAMLLIGQRAVLESDAYPELAGLMPIQIAELLQKREIQTSNQDIERLHQATKGNPRLLVLCIAIYEREREDGVQITFTNIVDTMSQKSGFAPYVNRLWDRLDPQQRVLLQRLSVYSGDTPQQYWLADDGEELKQVAETLLKLQIVEQAGIGTVALLPALREYIYREKLTPDRRIEYHLDAAIILAQLAQYTDAAYHFNLGDEPTKAIQLWFPVMEEEIQRGQTGIAYDIFINMPYRNLPNKETNALRAIQSRLHELYGELQAGLAVLKQGDRQMLSELVIQNLELEGAFKAALGHPYLAQQTYQDCIDLITRLNTQKTIMHCRIGMSHIRRNEINKVEEHVLKAEQEVLILRGTFAESKRELGIADEIYREALELARKLDNNESIALSHARISGIQRMLGNFKEALFHAKQAKINYDYAENRLESNRVDNLITAIQLDTGNYQATISLGEKTAKFFEVIEDTYFASSTFSAIAEAYFYLGKNEEAIKNAEKVLKYEEPFTMPYAHYTLGLVNQATKAYSAALYHFKESVKSSESSEDRFLEAFARQEYGKILCLHDVDKGKEELQNALNLFEQLGHTEKKKEVQKLLKKY